MRLEVSNSPFPSVDNFL